MSAITIPTPAAAAAAAHCWLASWAMSGGFASDVIRPRHPGECAWCAFPRDVLIEALTAFAIDGLGAHPSWPVRIFEGEPPSVQERAVIVAQGIDRRALREPEREVTEEELTMLEQGRAIFGELVVDDPTSEYVA